MDDYSFLIPDIEVEYKKYYDSLKKKYSKIKEPSETALKTIESLKKIIPNKGDNDSLANFKTELNKSLETLLKPIYLVIENKHTKLYLNSLSLLKKFAIYNLINDTEYSNIINYLKDIFSHQNEDIQLKVLEILQYIINGNVIKLTDTNINSIMSICKIDKVKGHVKFVESKNAIKLILSILAKKLFDITEDKNVLNFMQNLMNSIEGNAKEWNTAMTFQNSLIKGIRLELICSILETYPEKFREGEVNKFLEENLNVFIRKIFQMNNDQLIGIKLCRLTMIIVTVVNKNHLLLDEILKYINKNTQVKWKTILGLEVLSELYKKPEILFDMYLNNNELYKNIFQTFTNITYNTIISKSQKLNEKRNSFSSSTSTQNTSTTKKQNEHNQNVIIPNKKYIINNNIFINENDPILNISISNEYIFKLLTDCYISLKNSYVFLMEQNGININISSSKGKTSDKEKIVLNEKQEKIKEMINYNFVDFKGGLIGMLLHINDVTSVQTFIGIFQSFIYIYTSFDLPSSRDELLNDLCKLALPNNLQNVLEIKEKNISIIRTIFNLSHCTNLLEKNSWLIFIQTVQNLYYILIKSGYYLYNDKQQFNIDVIMRNIESNIKKYSFESSITEVQKVVQEDEVNKNINTISTILPTNKGAHNKEIKSKKTKGMNQMPNIRILTGEEKENIDILSNVVNNLFTDSNDYDDDTLINIINALYEDIEKKIMFYKKQLKFIYNSDNSLNTEGKRKNSDGDAQMNKKEDAIQNKKNLGKQTARNELFKSVMGDKMATTPGGPGANFNVNFLNEKILINSSNINFNLVKILGIAIININRIHLFWDKILSIVKLFSIELSEKNNFSDTIIKFFLDLLSYIIITILIKYKIKDEDEKDQNNMFNKKNIQTNIFTPFINLLNGYYNSYKINSNFMTDPLKNIVEKCGTKLNLYGWNHIFECINLILRNQDNKIDSQGKEILYKIIEQIFNEYSNYLTIFNIEVLLDILEKFSVDNENKNICYSSISFFWQCADIIDNYQKNKKELSGLESELYKEKCSNDENRIKFYENLWKKLFNKLIEINKDKRLDIKKSGINIFAQFFVAKIKSINEINNLSIDIINNIFFKIFNDNIQYFLNNEDDKIDEKEQNQIVNNEDNNEEKPQTNNNEGTETVSNDAKEEVVLFSLQSMGKVIKSFIEENKNSNNDNSKNNQKEMLKKLSSIYSELIEKKNSPQITINILKNIGEFESADKIFFQENREIFWTVIEKLISYINNKELFIEQYSKSVKGSKVIQSIIESLNAYFYSKDDIEILNSKSTINNNINSLIEIIQKLLNLTTVMEKSLINIDPYNIIFTEKNIFNLIETIGSYCKSYKDVDNMINYLLKLINYNKDDKHSMPISCMSMKTLGVILNNNISLLDNIEEEKLKNIVNECKDKIGIFFNLKNDQNLLSEIVKHNIKKRDKFVWENMISYFNNNILKSAIIKIKDEKLWEDILDFLVKIYKEVRQENNANVNQENNNEIKNNNINKDDENKEEEKKEEQNENEKQINNKEGELNSNENVNVINEEKKENNEENKDNTNSNKEEEQKEIIKSNKEIEKNIINFVINILLPSSGYISNNIQQKLLQYLDIESNSENSDNNNPDDKLFSIKQMNIENLFNVCNYKGEKEIEGEFIKEKNNEEKLNSINKYIEIKKNISKLFLPTLFKTCKEKIKSFIDDGKNKEEIIMILNGLKNLDSYCSELNDIPQNEIMKSCAKNKKGHLFLLHNYFNKMILTKDEEIKKKIYEIFEVIAQQMDLKTEQKDL